MAPSNSEPVYPISLLPIKKTSFLMMILWPFQEEIPVSQLVWYACPWTIHSGQDMLMLWFSKLGATPGAQGSLKLWRKNVSSGYFRHGEHGRDRTRGKRAMSLWVPFTISFTVILYSAPNSRGDWITLTGIYSNYKMPLVIFKMLH